MWQRKQSLSGRAVDTDDRPAQRTFTCVICQQAFLHASDCLDHMYAHTNKSPPQEDVEENSLHNGCVEASDELDVGESEKGEEKTKDVDSGGGGDSDGKTSASSFPESGSSVPEQMFVASVAKKVYKCEGCGKTFLGERALESHIRKHKGDHRYVCPICNRSFPTTSSLALHKRNHAGNRPFKCDFKGCDRAFPDLGSVNRHRRTHSDERPHVCQHCGKAFKMQNHLREHMRLHTGERPFVCEFCGAGFAQSNGLKSHAKQHSLDRDNQCNICHKAFSHPAFLELHKKVHSGEKPYTCEVCERTFRTACNLGAHRKLKHETVQRKREKDFTCDVCGASFSQACNLGIHKKKKHSDSAVSLEKNYVCDICDARFSEPCNLGAHKKIKHTEESHDGRSIFDCDICGAKFYRACNLSGHRRRKHGDTGDIRESDKHFVCQVCGLRCSTMENLQEHHTKIHFSMPPFFAQTKSSLDATRSQQPKNPSFNHPPFDDQHQSNLNYEQALSGHHSRFSQSFPESEHPVTFPNTVPPSTDPEKLSVRDSFMNRSQVLFMNRSQADPSSTEPAQLGSNKETVITPPCSNTNKMSFDQAASAFESRMPQGSMSSRHSSSRAAEPTACQICGAVIPDKRSMVQHLEMHSSDRFLHDVFSVQ